LFAILSRLALVLALAFSWQLYETGVDYLQFMAQAVAFAALFLLGFSVALYEALSLFVAWRGARGGVDGEAGG